MNTRILASAVLALPIFAAAQDVSPAPVAERWVYRPATPFRVDAETMSVDKVTVKFIEGIRVRLDAGGELVSLDGGDISNVNARLEGALVARLFTRPVAELDAERARLQTRLPAGQPPLADLNNYFEVTTSGVAATERLVDALLAEPLVETAYAQFIPIPLDDIPPTTPLFEGRQGYLDAAPSGYGHRLVETIVGARGQGLFLAQLEGHHTYGHEDMAQCIVADRLGASGATRYSSWLNHSTACVGIMVANRNGYGVRGMGSDCERFFTSSLASGASNMVSMATGVLRAGDVMSSSYAWVRAVGGTDYHAPADWVQSVYDAVRIAAAADIVYTFSAGNTSADLANTTIYGSRYVPGALSSGGFIIGATGAGDLSRVGFSNYGARVDANGWGRGVASTGYGSLFDPGDVLQRYTATFGGTSAAAPSVGGVIASLSGTVKEQLGRAPTATEIRTALQVTGTPIPGGGGTVGNRPDLVQLLATFGLPDGLEVTADAMLGGSFTIDVTGPSGTLFGVLLSTGRGRTAVSGANRDLLLDPTFLFSFAGGAIDASGTATHVQTVPNDPSLADLDLFIQAVQGRNGTLHLSNSSMLWVR